ncbi:MAG: hydrogenase expression/formation protein HypE [bacterium]|nr:hydrogenase expression/formation protein HypE [bacterium]
MPSDETIQIGHGSGGRLMHRLIDEVFAPALGGGDDDSAILEVDASRIAVSTDSYVVQPVFFPGGDIGKLAVCGTVNDLAVMGATPKYLTVGFILEEGLPIDDLRRIVASMAAAADEAGVAIIAGDTKVVERGAADKLFINTSGIGVFERAPARQPIQLGDVIMINGPIGDHGIAVMLAREKLPMSGDIASDCAPLNGLIADLLAACPDVRFIRDATRGGLATVLNEITPGTELNCEIDELDIPVHPPVAAACEVLGMEALYVANEGKIAVVVPEDAVDAVLAVMSAHRYGPGTAVIGRFVAGEGRVIGIGAAGTRRIIEMPLADQLPRIC